MPKHKLLSSSKRRCLDCYLYNKPHVDKWGVPTEIVYGKGAKKDDSPVFMFVGEAPGADENENGRPFIGRSGKLLRDFMKKRFPHVTYAIGNIIKCRPSPNNKLPSDKKTLDELINCCVKNVKRDIKKLDIQYLILLGGTALRGLVDSPPPTIAGAKATPHEVRIGKNKAIGLLTYHPSYILKQMRKDDGDNSFHASWLRDLTRYVEIALGEIKIESLASGASGKTSSGKGKAKKGSSGLKKGKARNIFLKTYKEIDKFLDRIINERHTYLSYDVETSNGTDIIKNKIISINMAFTPNEGYVFLWRHPKNACTPKQMKRLKKKLKYIFSSKEVGFKRYIAHNASFEVMQTVREFGVWPINRKWHDTQIWEHNFNPDGSLKDRALSNVVHDRLGIDPWPKGATDSIKSKSKILLLSVKDLVDYGAPDAYTLLMLVSEYRKIAKKEGRFKALLKYMDALDLGIVCVSHMQRNGLPFDYDLLHRLLEKGSLISKSVKEVEKKMKKEKVYRKANEDISKRFHKGKSLWESPWFMDLGKREHLEILIVDHMGIEPGKSDAGNYKFDKQFFDKFDTADDDDSPLGLLQQWRKLKKLQSSYLKSLGKYYRHADTKRIHAWFGLANTRTGRLNSEKPNMQQMPSPSNAAKKAVKNLIQAEDGYVLIESDFSQAEVRYLGQVTGDKELIRIFKNVRKLRDAYFKNPTKKLKERLKFEGDVHLNTASTMFGVPLEKVEKQQRKQVKGIVFGLTYGMGNKSLAIILGTDEKGAEQKTDQFFKPFKEVKKWLSAVKKKAQKDHYVDCLFGRRRPLVDYDMGDSGAGDRKAANTAIQNPASDHNLFSAGRIIKYIIKNKKKWEIIALVHDSILAHVPVDEIEEYVRFVRKEQSDTKWLSKKFGIDYKVRFIVDFEIGKRWAELTEWDGSLKHLKKIQKHFSNEKNR